MKRAKLIGDNVMTFRIDEESCEAIDKEIVKKQDFYCSAVVDILERMEEGEAMILFDEKDNSFI